MWYQQSSPRYPSCTATPTWSNGLYDGSLLVNLVRIAASTARAILAARRSRAGCFVTHTGTRETEVLRACAAAGPADPATTNSIVITTQSGASSARRARRMAVTVAPVLVRQCARSLDAPQG